MSKFFNLASFLNVENFCCFFVVVCFFLLLATNVDGILLVVMLITVGVVCAIKWLIIIVEEVIMPKIKIDAVINEANGDACSAQTVRNRGQRNCNGPTFSLLAAKQKSRFVII